MMTMSLGLPSAVATHCGRPLPRQSTRTNRHVSRANRLCQHRSVRCSAEKEDPEAPGSFRDYKGYGAKIERDMEKSDKDYPTDRLSMILYSAKIGDVKGVLSSISKPIVTATAPIVALSLLWTLSTGKGLRALSGFGLDETALGVFEGASFALFAFFLYYEAQKFLDGVLGVGNRRKF